MNYSTQELIDMVYTLGECHKNCFLASRVYREKFPDRRSPDLRTFQKLRERFDRTGTVKYEKLLRAKTVTTAENGFNVIASAVEDPHSSTAELSSSLEISQSSVKKILKQNGFHPYRMQVCHGLSATDYQNRVNFCHWALSKIEENPEFFNLVLFTDEATFHSNGRANRKNFHYYADTNPHFVRPVDQQHRWSINVWGGTVAGRVIGPHFFNGHINGPIFEDFLNEELDDLLEEVPLGVLRTMWFQLDGAPAHFSARVRTVLNRSFPDRWMGRGGPIAWPPRSPDLTKLDFFYGGMLKTGCMRHLQQLQKI